MQYSQKVCQCYLICAEKNYQFTFLKNLLFSCVLVTVKNKNDPSLLPGIINFFVRHFFLSSNIYQP